MVLWAGCSHGGGPISCGDETCDGSSQYCESFSVEGAANDGTACRELPGDYDTQTCEGLCDGGDSITSCHCNGDGCSVHCQSP
jgi:hypothetical protein